MDRVEYDHLPPQDVRLEMCDWLRHHCINPNDVAVPGWIELRSDARQIAYEAYYLDEQGVPIIDPDGDDAVRVTRVMQLEARPSPLPTALKRSATPGG